MAGWKLRKDKTQAEPFSEENYEPPVLAEAAPAAEAQDDLLPLPAVHWEVPADDWNLPAQSPHIEPIIAEPIIAEPAMITPGEDEPAPAEEMPLAETPPEETEYHFRPLDMGAGAGADATHAAPVFETDEEDEEDSEPLPHFDDDEPAAPDAHDDVIAMPEPETIALAQEIIAPPAPEIPASEPEVITAPETEDVTASPPSIPSSPLFTLPPSPLPELSTSTLRLDRSELAPAASQASGFSIPPVSPFLLDVPKAAAQETVHTLLVRIGRLSATFEIMKEVTVIGRPDSELHYYPDIEVEMDDAVSRRHAEILRHEDDFYLVDAGSTNGTQLNGQMLTPHEEHRLAHGDRIRVGDRTEIIFE